MPSEALIKAVVAVLLPVSSAAIMLALLSDYRRRLVHRRHASHLCYACTQPCFCGGYHMLDCSGCGCSLRTLSSKPGTV